MPEDWTHPGTDPGADRGTPVDALRLWELLFGELRGYLVTFVGRQSERPDARPNELDGTEQRSWRYPDDRAKAAGYLRRRSEEGFDAYFGVHLFEKPGRRRKENALPRVGACWVDGDGAKVPEGWPEPNVVVASSPGREHYYWLLSEPVSSEDAAWFSKRLTYGMGGDRGKWGLGTVLRVPETCNYKREEPTLVTARLLLEERHDPAEMDRRLPTAEAAVPGTSRAQTNGGGTAPEVVSSPQLGEPPVRLRGRATEIWDGRRPILAEGGEVDRSRTLHQIAGVLRRAGATDATIIRALAERDRTLGYGKYLDRPAEYGRIVQKVELGSDDNVFTLANTGTSRSGRVANEGAKAEDQTPKRVEGRVPLKKAVEEGVEPSEELEPDILVRGRIHSIYAPASSGKSWMVLWLAKRCVERRERVLVMDDENGPKIVAERLRALGVPTDDLDDLLHYYADPALPMDIEVIEAYERLLDELEPALVIFDSLIGFLVGAGFEEHSNDGVAAWAKHYARPARKRGIAVVVLDHVGHEGSRYRGASRKKDAVDVMWALSNPVPFDRENVGEVRLRREKDREGVLPFDVTFSVGGGERGFVFARSEGTIETTDEEGLTNSARRLLGYLGGRAEEGATWKEMALEMGSKSTLSRALTELGSRNLFSKANKRYYRHPPVEPKNRAGRPDSGGSTRFHEGSAEPMEPSPIAEGSIGSTTLRGGTVEPEAEPAREDPGAADASVSPVGREPPAAEQAEGGSPELRRRIKEARRRRGLEAEGTP